MTMSDGALDLSVSSYGGISKHIQRPMDHVTRPMDQVTRPMDHITRPVDHVTRPMDHITRPVDHVTRPMDHVSSDSGRASSDSTSSETHEDIKPIIASSPNGLDVPHSHSSGSLASSVATGPIAFPTSHIHDLSQLSHVMRSNLPSASPPHQLIPGNDRGFSNPSSPGQVTSMSGDDLMKSGDRIPDPRGMSMKHFKMYPMDPFNMYNNPLMAGATGALSPSPAAFQSLYDSVSPSGFPSFPLTPLTSHLLQRKRRAENRDHSASTTTTTTTTTNSYPGGGNVSGGEGNGSSRVSTSSPVSQGGEDSNGSDGERRKRSTSSADVKKDEAYWDRRRKNNEAAKRSRDARRQKEEEIAMRAAFLEQENLKLRAQVAILKNETAKLHYMLYNRI